MESRWIAARTAGITLGLFALGLMFRPRRFQVMLQNSVFYDNAGWGITASGSDVSGDSLLFNVENAIFSNAKAGSLDRYGDVTPGRYQIVSVSPRVYYPAGYVELSSPQP